MKQITSFCINHDCLEKGFYLSRVDGDVITYDIRMAKPNSGIYPSNPALHSFEHLFATYVRNSPATGAIVYVGPMGCRTGFYFLTRDSLGRQEALELFRQTLEYILAFEGTIPGTATSRECGNYLEHDLAGAKAIARDMKEVLASWTVEQMTYRE